MEYTSILNTRIPVFSAQEKEKITPAKSGTNNFKRLAQKGKKLDSRRSVNKLLKSGFKIFSIESQGTWLRRGPAQGWNTITSI